MTTVLVQVYCLFAEMPKTRMNETSNLHYTENVTYISLSTYLLLDCQEKSIGLYIFSLVYVNKLMMKLMINPCLTLACLRCRLSLVQASAMSNFLLTEKNRWCKICGLSRQTPQTHRKLRHMLLSANRKSSVLLMSQQKYRYRQYRRQPTFVVSPHVLPILQKTSIASSIADTFHVKIAILISDTFHELPTVNFMSL